MLGSISVLDVPRNRLGLILGFNSGFNIGFNIGFNVEFNIGTVEPDLGNIFSFGILMV